MTICDKIEKNTWSLGEKGFKTKVSLCITLLHPHNLCPYKVFLFTIFCQVAISQWPTLHLFVKSNEFPMINFSCSLPLDLVLVTNLILQGLEIIEGSILSCLRSPPFVDNLVDVDNRSPHIHLHHHPLSLFSSFVVDYILF